jgi:DNA polymerase V
MCNKLAKKRGGVCEWEKLDKESTLASVDVGDIWGIGRSKTAYLKSKGVNTALDLKRYPLSSAKKYLTISGFRTVRELNGYKDINQVEPDARQGIVVSRSFSQAVFDLEDLSGALADYAQEAVKRLREDGLLCRVVSVYLRTSYYSDKNTYCNSTSCLLPAPTSFFPDILTAASSLLGQIYKRGYSYKKVLVSLSGLTSRHLYQAGLFDDYERDEKRESVMLCFDALNYRYGRGTLRTATAYSCNKGIEMRREFLSPAYTTRLSDIPLAR